MKVIIKYSSLSPRHRGYFLIKIKRLIPMFYRNHALYRNVLINLTSNFSFSPKLSQRVDHFADLETRILIHVHIFGEVD